MYFVLYFNATPVLPLHTHHKAKQLLHDSSSRIPLISAKEQSVLALEEACIQLVVRVCEYRLPHQTGETGDTQLPLRETDRS
jgi:hypothetical protein